MKPTHISVLGFILGTSLGCGGAPSKASNLASAASAAAEVETLYTTVQRALATPAFQSQLRALSAGKLSAFDQMVNGTVVTTHIKESLASFNSQFPSLDSFIAATGVNTGAIGRTDIEAALAVGKAFQAGALVAPSSTVSPARLVYVSSVLALVFTPKAVLGLQDSPWQTADGAGNIISNYNGARIYYHNDGNVTADCGTQAQTTHQQGTNNSASCVTRPNAQGQAVRATATTTTDPNTKITTQSSSYQNYQVDAKGSWIPVQGPINPGSNYLPPPQ